MKRKGDKAITLSISSAAGYKLTKDVKQKTMCLLQVSR